MYDVMRLFLGMEARENAIINSDAASVADKDRAWDSLDLLYYLEEMYDNGKYPDQEDWSI